MKGINDQEQPTLAELLSHRTLGRVLEPHEIAAEFALIRVAFEREGKAVPSADDVRRVARASGTHLLKLVSPRAPVGQHLVRFTSSGSNQQPRLYPSLDAKMSRVAKLVFRPFEVTGHPARSLVEHILQADDISIYVTLGFAETFGDGSLDALTEALTTPLVSITSLPVAEFPIIFLPRPGGGDIQATPLAPAEAYVRFREITAPYFQKNEEGKPRAPRGRWSTQYVADKPQNISSAVGKKRTRFLATMPRVQDKWTAELCRYVQGGEFPRWRDDSVVQALDDYARLLERSSDYSNQDIRLALDRRAGQLIHDARTFIDETVSDVIHGLDSSDAPSPPPVSMVILRCHRKSVDVDRARRVLTSVHFKHRLHDLGEA